MIGFREHPGWGASCDIKTIQSKFRAPQERVRSLPQKIFYFIFVFYLICAYII
jgi:hypothetical protein